MYVCMHVPIQRDFISIELLEDRKPRFIELHSQFITTITMITTDNN